MWKEFQDFIDRGNVMDLAVGVILGTATTAVVNSLVDDVLSPIIGIFLGGVDFGDLALQIGEASVRYGAFINAVINFFVVAFVLFLIVRSLNQMHIVAEEKKKEAAEPTELEVLQQILKEMKSS